MATSRLVTLGGAAAALLAAALLGATSGAPREAEPVVPVEPVAVRGLHVEPMPRPTAQSILAQLPLPAPQPLAPLLDAPATELRATLQMALARRAEGGRLYARALARRCAALGALAEPPPADVNNAHRQAAQQQRQMLATGCGQMLTPEWLALASVPADEPGPADPLLHRLEQGDAAPDWPAAVLARPDPLLLDELGPRLLAREGESYVFDGERFDTDDSRRLIEAALRLLPCDFGLACDGRDPEIWLACLRGEACHGSRAEQIWAEEAGRDPTRYAAITAWRTRLREAILAGAVERFQVPASGAISKPVSIARQM